MDIWTITYNSDFGINTTVSNSEIRAEMAAEDWVELYREQYGDVVDFERPWREVFESLCETAGFIDSIHVERHTVHPPEPTDPIEKALIKAAQARHNEDGECEVDDNTIVLMGDAPGAYVQAWVWVDFEHIATPLAIIERDGTVWYFERFDQFLEAWWGAPNFAACALGTPELLEMSGGVNDAWEFLTAKDDSLKFKDVPLYKLQELRRAG